MLKHSIGQFQNLTNPLAPDGANVCAWAGVYRELLSASIRRCTLSTTQDPFLADPGLICHFLDAVFDPNWRVVGVCKENPGQLKSCPTWHPCKRMPSKSKFLWPLPLRMMRLQPIVNEYWDWLKIAWRCWHQTLPWSMFWRACWADSSKEWSKLGRGAGQFRCRATNDWNMMTTWNIIGTWLKLWWWWWWWWRRRGRRRRRRRCPPNIPKLSVSGWGWGPSSKFCGTVELPLL